MTGPMISPRKTVTVLYFHIALIIILGFSVYANSLNGQFLWDDGTFIKDNIYIKNPSYIPKIFTKDLFRGGAKKSNYYRPLQMITYMIDYSIWRLDVRGYHLTNILLHISVALAVYWLINALYRDRLISLLTSIFFVVHPINTGPVSYISGRSDSLGALFMLFSLILYIKVLHLHKGKVGLCILMTLSYIGAVLSREGSLILPVLLLLYHYTFTKRIKLKVFSPFLVITFIYILLRVTFLRTFLAHPVSSVAFFQRVPGFFVAITNYIRLLVAPFHLFHMEYGNLLFNLASPKAILGILIVFSSLIYAVRNRNSSKLVFFSISWFFVALLPVSNLLYPLNVYMADNWLYVPSIGAFLLLAKILSYLYRKEKGKIPVFVLIVSLLSFYFYLTIKQNEYFARPIAFYKRILKYAPDSKRVHHGLGDAYRDIGKKEEAILWYKKAIEIDPNYAEVYNNLGNIYKDIKKEEAIASYKKAIELNPNYAEAYNNLGNIYKDIDKKEEAIALYKEAIKENPDFAAAYNNLGFTYYDIGKREEAITSYKKAIKIYPDFAVAYNNLGNVLKDIDRDEAIALYKKAIKINPNYAAAHNNLALTYYYAEQYDLAIKHYDKAIELGWKINPDFLKRLEPYRK